MNLEGTRHTLAVETTKQQWNEGVGVYSSSGANTLSTVSITCGHLQESLALARGLQGFLELVARVGLLGLVGPVGLVELLGRS